MTAARLYPITKPAAEFGVTLRALRIYEEKGLLTPQRQRLNITPNVRHYTEADRIRLRRILESKALGLTLTEIKAMLDRPSADTALPVALTRAEAQARVAL